MSDKRVKHRWFGLGRGMAAVLCAGLVAASAACTPQSTEASSASAAGEAAPIPAGLERFYTQELDWQGCAEGETIVAQSDSVFDCALMTVPLDYSAPDGETITVAVKRRAARSDSLGALFVNPGGPGGSAFSLVDNAASIFSQDVTARYDVVGMDPRGVGASSPVDCLTDAELDAARAGDDVVGTGEAGAEAAGSAASSGEAASSSSSATEASAEEAQAEVAALAAERARQCAQATEASGVTPAILDHIDTVSVARDMDVLRAVLGDNKLTYLGYSYGTYLGSTYAELFPANVGRMVLDAAIDPSLSAGQLASGQAAGFEAALRTFVTDCQAGNDCPLSGGVDAGMEQLREFLDRTKTSPVPTSDVERPLTYSLALSAIIGPMYQDEAWPALSQALTEAMHRNDGSRLLFIADVFASRNDDGTYSGNGDEVIAPINCLDYPVEGGAASWAREAEQLRELSPTLGEDLAYSDLYCQSWGHTSTRERGPIAATGSAPIVVIGTTGDPATPYAWSQALAEQLDNGVLLTWEGHGHTAYGRAGSCIRDAVDEYLLSGTVPEDGLVCRGR